MHLATMTNLHQVYRDNPDYFSTVECIHACADAGYRHLDLSMSGITAPGRPLHEKATHRAWLGQVKQAMRERSMAFSQAHAVFYGTKLDPESQEFAQFVHNIADNFDLASELSIPWMVVHPIRCLNGENPNDEATFTLNVAFFRSLLPLIERSGVGVAIENMNAGPFVSAKALLDLLAALDDHEGFGLCWDTGHAHLTSQDQVQSILTMGKRLKVTHIADNRGVKDDHLLPLSGTIDWPPLVGALKQSGYEGDFSYEAPNATMNYPPELRPEVLRLSFHIGQHLLR